MKQCSSCKQHLPAEKFSPDKTRKLGLSSLCKTCKNDRYSTRYNKTYRDNRLKKLYNLNQGEYEAMLIAQNYKCKICGSLETGRGDRWLVVDHCHATNRIRGLLCNTCNRALGLFKDNITTLEKALFYLNDTSTSNNCTNWTSGELDK
jgi:hypothetical protein